MKSFLLVALMGCHPEPNLCADAPVADWDNFGRGFLTENCQACHSSDAFDRHGAPADITFDTEAEVATHLDRILARATGEEPTMPPEGGVTEDDRLLLEVWLTCYPPE